MKAVVFHGNDDLRFESMPEPRILKPTDAIVRVTTTTICGSDIHIRHHGIEMGVKPGTILGHEFVGVVEEVGEMVESFIPGDRVAVSCIYSCGTCFYCQNGLPSQCPEGACFGTGGDGTNHGAQAEYIRVPFALRTMHKIPDTLSDEDVLFVGDILSTGYFGAKNGEVKDGDVVVVNGAGPVGMCAMISARLLGASRVIAIDLDQQRLDFVQKQGLTQTAINPGNENPAMMIKSLTRGKGADVVIEAVGNKKCFENVFFYVRRGGIISLLGVYNENVNFPIQKLWWRNLSLKMGLVNVMFMEDLMKLIELGKINTRFLISRILPFDEIIKGYDVFEQRIDGALKVVLKP